MTIGLDLGDTYSHYKVLDGTGEVVAAGRVRTTLEALREQFGGMEPARIAVEAGTHSPWVSRLLSSLKHEVLVANPRQIPLIYENTKKSDKTDPENLARVARLDPKLLKAIQHRSEADQASLAILRSRDSLVAARTQLINHVRGSVKATGRRLPSCSGPSFHQTASEAIPDELKPALLPVLEAIRVLTRQIHQHDKSIERDLCNNQYPATKILRQVPGVGPITALAFILVLQDPRRFKTSRAVGSYLGLVPRRDDSGEQSPQLRITKAGDGFLRRLMVSAAQYILGPFGPDNDLRAFGGALASRGGKNAKKRAVVAVARKLSVLLHRLWITGEVYEPLREAARKRRGRAPQKDSSNHDQ
jgi:transposase